MPVSTVGERTSPRTDCPWFAAAGIPLDIRFSVALDGLSLWLFVLTALLLVVAVLISWEAIKDQQSLYYRLLLLLGTGMLGVFVARDIILFYLFFEFTLVPLFFLIGIWGSEQRRYAAIKFFLFTLAGSVLTLLGLLAIVLWDWHARRRAPMTFSIPDLTAHLHDHPMPYGMQVWLFLALFAGFAIKVPLFPLHTWLPLAHTEAPAAGSILLAGVLLKIGTYGFLRFSLPMLPEATAACMPWLLWLSVAGIIYGALVALAQSDLKRLIAYSSVSHLGFCMLGIFALNRVAVQGGALADDQPRAVDRRPVRHGRHALRTLPHAADRRLRRHRPRDARAGLLHGLHDAGQHRPAGAERLRGRVPPADGHVPAGLGSGGDASGPRSTASFPCWPSAASCWGPGTCCRWWPGSSSAPCASGSTPGRSPTSASARCRPWRLCAWSSSGSACSRSSSSTAWPPASIS